jgi:spore germination protein GerM
VKTWIVLGLIGFGILAGSGVALFGSWFSSNSSSEKTEKLPSATVPTPDLGSKDSTEKKSEFKPTTKPDTPPSNPDNAGQEDKSYGVRVYQIQPKGDRLAAIPTTVKAKSSEKALQEAMLQLISQANSKNSDLVSEIPAQTKLLNLSIKGQEIRLNLSQEFTSGGGAASMNGRLAQVLYTATSLDRDAKLYLSVEGKPLKYLGGEGLEVLQPLTRKDLSPEF